MSPNDRNAERFLSLIRESRRGKLKVYIGMSAGVGKSYRMLQVAHNLPRNGVDVPIGFIETHRRAETEALTSFFQADKILQLRELALKEVAGQVERKMDLTPAAHARNERFLVAISGNHEVARCLIRKTARLASYYNSRWFVPYVQTPAEASDRIRLNMQRHLINNLKLATELGAEVIQAKGRNIVDCIMEEVERRQVTTVCIGKPHFSLARNLVQRAGFG